MQNYVIFFHSTVNLGKGRYQCLSRSSFTWDLHLKQKWLGECWCFCSACHFLWMFDCKVHPTSIVCPQQLVAIELISLDKTWSFSHKLWTITTWQLWPHIDVPFLLYQHQWHFSSHVRLLLTQNALVMTLWQTNQHLCLELFLYSGCKVIPHSPTRLQMVFTWLCKYDECVWMYVCIIIIWMGLQQSHFQVSLGSLSVWLSTLSIY